MGPTIIILCPDLCLVESQYFGWLKKVTIYHTALNIGWLATV